MYSRSSNDVLFSILFCYNVDEMPQELFIINQPVVKLVLLYIILLEVTEPIDNIKSGLTVISNKSVWCLCLWFFSWISLWIFRNFLDAIQIFFYFCEKYSGILIEIALNLYMALGSMDILIILILLTHEHKIAFHLFVSSSISFISALQFSVYISFTLLVKLILSCYFCWYCE